MKFLCPFGWRVVFLYIYYGILICGKHGIGSHKARRNHFHRLKNTSYFVLVPFGSILSDIQSQNSDEVKNYLISRNNPSNNNLPQTSVRSSKFGVNKKRPWLRFNKRLIRNNARAEEQVIYRPNIARTAEMNLGDYTISTSAKNNLSAPDCGIFSSKYIVGGREAPIGAHPWIVHLLVNGQSWCSATIINEWWVVTAAHAFEFIGTNPDQITIAVGSNERAKGKIYRVTKIIVHARYDVNKFKSSDIAVMKIDGPIEMEKYVRPICLPQLSYQEVKAKSLIVAGWGFMRYGQPILPKNLLQVELNILPLEKCAQIYSDIKYKIFKSQICTHNEGQDACQGDSGGPAVEYINGRGTLVGVVSYGVTCADKYPGVFTKVSYYINWIQNAINRN